MLFRNLGKGRFEELIDQAGSGIQEPHNSRGCAFGDFDNDGDLDILIVNLNEPPSLLRNDVTGSNSWLKVKLIGTKSNRSAIGARVVVKPGTQRKRRRCKANRVSCPATISACTLAGAGEERGLKIRWPSGEWQTISSCGCKPASNGKGRYGDCAQPGLAEGLDHQARRPRYYCGSFGSKCCLVTSSARKICFPASC